MGEVGAGIPDSHHEWFADRGIPEFAGVEQQALALRAPDVREDVDAYRTPENVSTKRRGFTTKRDAEDFANSVEVAKLSGEYVAPSLGRATVGQLGPGWLAQQAGHMKPSGHRSYESAWRIHVEPRWGAVQIADIRYSDVAAWVAELSAKRGPVIVETAASVLRRILDDAVKDRLLASNPARGVKLPRRAPRHNVYLTRDQLDMLATEAGRYRSLVLLLGTVGLRWGEAPRCGSPISTSCTVASG